MYVYDQYDQKIVDERVQQFASQTKRFLDGKLSEDEYRPLRLQNGLYVQRYAPMLRVAIPYGLLNSKQLRKFAFIADKFDKGYAHFTTRQNLQYNWPALETVPEILAELASVQMHAIQTSGNCIRNTTSDQLAGIAKDELEDPRPYCEIIRQWSTLHPEFAYLPRKFKIAVSGAEHDRAAVQVHDIGLYLVENNEGEVGFKVLVGGGLGRTPMVGVTICDFLPKQHLLSYLEAILRVYNKHGRRDNKYRARIKITVKETGLEKFRELVEAEWTPIKDGPLLLTDAEIERVKGYFTAPNYDASAAKDTSFASKREENKAFSTWVRRNTVEHKVNGYRAVYISLKSPKVPPGDISSEQLNVVADLADEFSYGECRVTHTQNLLLSDVKQADLFALWEKLNENDLATPNIGTLTDMIACPGGDFCALANATTISIAEQINQKFSDLDYLYDLGDIRLNMSGCMNACGHHHVGNIGILGVDKKGAEFYQITLGGSSSNEASLGDRLGPSLGKDEVADTLEKIIEVFANNRDGDETFLETYKRIGMKPFKESVYA